jgi:Domain of unknown function (DUF1854)
MSPTPSTNGNSPSPELNLYRDAHGRLVYTDTEGRSHVGVAVVRAFPLSAPRQGIALCDTAGRELLWIDDLDQLPPATRRILEEELAQREFVPILRRVLRISTTSEPSEWEVETDRGVTRFILDNQDNVHRIDDRLTLIKDSQGLRYLIPDLQKLDATSRRLLERFL